MRDIVVRYRRWLVVAMHLLLWSAALLLAVLLRFEFEIPRQYGKIMPAMLGLSLTVRSLVHWRLGLFHGLWRYSGSRDLRSLIVAATLSSAFYSAAWAFTHADTFPRSIFVFDWAFSILIVGGLRFTIRTVREVSLQSVAPKSDEPRRRLLVVGAGDAGEMLMREIVRLYGRRYEPIGFVDDNTTKHGEAIHGIRVLGPIEHTAEIAERERIDEIVIAIPSLNGKQMRAILQSCQPTKAHIRTLPGVDNLIDGRVVSQLAEVNITDLLGREPVVLDTAALEGWLEGRVVMVTGAGGSIGSELSRQVCRYRPARLVLLDQAENGLFHAERSLRTDHPEIDIVAVIADICDTKRMEQTMSEWKPSVLFHAAAHKHVPLMEANPGEAIKNNVFGTKKLADLAHRHGVEKFVMVSTDKAVNPSSIMGVSKRVAEIYVQALSQRSKTQFVTVRFGNVLGSAGSVVPIFKEQIARGGPVMVTHPEMQRYFMTIPEACQLVLQAGAMGNGGEILVLDMGEPVKIVDLARDLIRLSGLEPDVDIEIQFSGMRPGEKLFEELAVDEEKVDKTKHAKIYVGRFRPHRLEDLDGGLVELHHLSDGSDPMGIRRAFKSVVPEYQVQLDDAVVSAAPPAEPREERASRPTPIIAMVN